MALAAWPSAVLVRSLSEIWRHTGHISQTLWLELPVYWRTIDHGTFISILCIIDRCLDGWDGEYCETKALSGSVICEYVIVHVCEACVAGTLLFCSLLNDCGKFNCQATSYYPEFDGGTPSHIFLRLCRLYLLMSELSFLLACVENFISLLDESLFFYWFIYF